MVDYLTFFMEYIIQNMNEQFLKNDELLKLPFVNLQSQLNVNGKMYKWTGSFFLHLIKLKFTSFKLKTVDEGNKNKLLSINLRTSLLCLFLGA